MAPLDIKGTFTRGIVKCPAIPTRHRQCHTRVTPVDTAVAILNLGVDPYVLVGVFLLWLPLGYCCGGGIDSTTHQRRAWRQHIPRLIQDPIPFLILVCLILLTVWAWRWFKGR